MKSNHFICKLLAIAALSAGALGLGTQAQAQNQGVYWSVGLSSPGVQVGVSNAPAVIAYPAPRVVVVPQQPVYLAQQPVLVQPQVSYYPVYGQPVYGYPLHGRPVVVPQQVVQQVQWAGWHHGHHGHHGQYGHHGYRY